MRTKCSALQNSILSLCLGSIMSFAAVLPEHQGAKAPLKEPSKENSDSESEVVLAKNTKAATHYARVLVNGMGCEDLSTLVPYMIPELRTAINSGVSQNMLDNIIFDLADDRTKNHYNSTYEFITSRAMSLSQLLLNSKIEDITTSQEFSDKLKAIAQEARSHGFQCRLSNSEKNAIYRTPRILAKESDSKVASADSIAKTLELDSARKIAAAETEITETVAEHAQGNTGNIEKPSHHSPKPDVHIAKASSYDKTIADYGVDRFESPSCRSVEKTTRRMLYEEFVRELTAIKKDQSFSNKSQKMVRDYSKLSFVACAESDGQAFVVSSHTMERELSFPTTSKDFNNKVRAHSSSIGEKIRNMGVAVGNFIHGRSVFNTLNDLRKYYGETPNYTSRVGVFDYQTNFGVYQMSADRMYMEPTRSFMQQRLKDIQANNRSLEYCQMSSFYPNTTKELFVKQFNAAADKMKLVMSLRNPYQEWRDVDADRDGIVDHIRIRDPKTQRLVSVPDPKKVKKLAALRLGIWAFADMMAMCPRLNLDLGKITMAQYGSSYYGPLKSSSLLSYSKPKCSDGKEMLSTRNGRANRSRVLSSLGVQTCSQVFYELKRRFDVGQIFTEPKSTLRTPAALKTVQENEESTTSGEVGESTLPELLPLAPPQKTSPTPNEETEILPPPN